MSFLDATLWQKTPRVRLDTRFLSGWLLLAVPILAVAIALFQLPVLWLGPITYAVVAAMCAELAIRVVIYVCARRSLSQR